MTSTANYSSLFSYHDCKSFFFFFFNSAAAPYLFGIPRKANLQGQIGIRSISVKQLKGNCSVSYFLLKRKKKNKKIYYLSLNLHDDISYILYENIWPTEGSYH